MKKCMHVSYSNFIEENQQINIATHLLWDNYCPPGVPGIQPAAGTYHDTTTLGYPPGNFSTGSVWLYTLVIFLAGISLPALCIAYSLYNCTRPLSTYATTNIDRILTYHMQQNAGSN